MIWSDFGKRLVQQSTAALARAALGAVGLTGNETIAGVKTFSSNPVLSGGGIQFPATQVPSADANALDDYEEGTFTPAISFGGASVGVTYTRNVGFYTKIGNLVFYEIDIILSAKGSSTGVAQIGTLPFVKVASHNTPVAMHVHSVTSGVGDTMLSARHDAGTTNIKPFKIVTGTATQLTDADVTNTTQIFLSGKYRV
jgi:hypothetical protein